MTREVWNRPVFDVKKRRPEPKFLAVQDVRVATGYGAIFVRSTEGEAPACDRQVTLLLRRRRRSRRGDRAALIRNVGGKAPEANMAARPGANTAVKGKQWAVITDSCRLPRKSRNIAPRFATCAMRVSISTIPITNRLISSVPRFRRALRRMPS